MMADFINKKNGGIALTWGGRDIVPHGEVRDAYIASLRAADRGDFTELLIFAVQQSGKIGAT